MGEYAHPVGPPIGLDVADLRWPPLAERDAKHVEACMAAGGYPRAERIGGQTVHIHPPRPETPAPALGPALCPTPTA